VVQNPQQDIQAQARCHRIGQTKDVAVYRLVTVGAPSRMLRNTQHRTCGTPNVRPAIPLPNESLLSVRHWRRCRRVRTAQHERPWTLWTLVYALAAHPIHSAAACSGTVEERIVQRAQNKRKLELLVTQHVEAPSALSLT
jgi:hypothetical protein